MVQQVVGHTAHVRGVLRQRKWRRGKHIEKRQDCKRAPFEAWVWNDELWQIQTCAPIDVQHIEIERARTVLLGRHGALASSFFFDAQKLAHQGEGLLRVFEKQRCIQIMPLRRTTDGRRLVHGRRRHDAPESRDLERATAQVPEPISEIATKPDDEKTQERSPRNRAGLVMAFA